MCARAVEQKMDAHRILFRGGIAPFGRAIRRLERSPDRPSNAIGGIILGALMGVALWLGLGAFVRTLVG
jgi:hypothetical protein